MGSIFSATASPSPSDSPEQNPKTTATKTTTAMSSSPSDKPTSPEPEPTVKIPKTLESEIPNEESTDPSPANEEGGNQEAEEGECGFCLFMKGGECRETFINWEKCVEEGEKNDEDIVNKCFEATSALKKCMEAHPDYYGVILQAEKDAEQEVSNQLDREKEHVAENSSDSNSGEQQQQQQKQEIN